jgi:hypothetical protein
MSVQYPYRAVICGEEYIVKGWRGGNLLTNKGEFVFGLLHGDDSIYSTRLVEVALVQSDENGEWLLNGHNLRMLQFLPEGNRLSDITSDEDLRVYKGEIRAAAWVQTNSAWNITQLLDSILTFWKTASQPEKVKEMFSPYQQIGVGLGNAISSFTLFKDWGKPIWLAKFHPVVKDNLDPAGVKIVPAQPANVPVKAVEPTKNNAIQVSQPKSVARAENVVAPTTFAPEYFTSIKAAAKYAQKSERTIKNWKRDGWLKVEQVGKKIRIAKNDLEKCIKKQ